MDQINASLAAILQLPADCVNVKAKTNEKLGFEGKEEGLWLKQSSCLRLGLSQPFPAFLCLR